MKDYISKTKVNTRLATSIPSAIRTKFDIEAGDELYWDIEDNKIVIKLEDNEDKLNYLYLRLHTIEKSLQKDLQKIFETTLPRNYYLTRKKIKVSITHRNHTILVTIPRGKKIEFLSKEREFKRLLFKSSLNMYSNTTKKETNIFIIC